MSTAAVQAAREYPQMSSNNYPNPASPGQYLQNQDFNDESYYLNQDVKVHPQPSRQHKRNITTQATPTSNYSDQFVPSAHQATTSTIPIHSRNQSLPTDQYDGAPHPPPRSSSNQQYSPNAVPTSSRQGRQNAERQTSSNANNIGNYVDPMRERPRDDTATTAAGAARPRRKGPASPEGPHRAASTRERGQQAGLPIQSRSEATMVSHPLPAPLVRENSEVINRVVVSDPLVDEQRLQERVAEARPAPIGELSPTTGIGFPPESAEEPRQQRRQDYSKSSRRKDVQFGDYVLGQTLGEGEFGKVKLGWKRDGSTQVAIKLIRRESVATNPSRLPKIEREIHILRDLAHPNIVRLHEMVETERHIGIILEYASGGELFDYILNQRYLKDPQARRLFAQLVSGVGYLHKKGIVHRDLKLENLLLDQNKNIIITDFGFANTFNPADELSSEIEYNLSNKDFVKKYKLDRLDANGMRKGDLMQTSCGSPCYAAPELVVSDSLYTGRKVDVWSCGVILYAMLAGYLPFDDDPANPEGDNINLLYKYITTTPLTFPEYVSPHARDLLRRILVPDPRKRADLFEVARHSWLNEYHHVVAHITSSTTNIADIANSTVPSEMAEESLFLARSASVRAPKSASPRPAPQTSAGIVTDHQDSASKREKSTRHTLQPEYVEPQTQTARITPDTATTATPRAESQSVSAIPTSLSNKQLPPDPPKDSPDLSRSQPPSSMPAPVRPGRDVPRSVSDNTGAFVVASSAPQPTTYATRPSTQGSLNNTNAPTARSDLRLPSRGSYGQPVAPTVAATNVQGKVTQPAKPGRGYNISGPLPQHSAHASMSQPMTQPMPPQQPSASQSQQYHSEPSKGHHRRSSTLSNLSERLFGRSNSVHKKQDTRDKVGRKYPPTAMKDPYPSEPQPRMSTDSKRSFSFGLKKKESSELDANQYEEKPKRFSLIPSSMSFKNILGGGNRDSREQFAESQSSQQSYNTQYSNRPPTGQGYAPNSSDGQQDRRFNNFSRPPQAQYHRYQQSTGDVYGGTGVYNADTDQSHSRQHQRQQSQNAIPQYPEGFSESRTSMQQSRPSKSVLTKPNRRFTDAYESEGSHLGSSGAVKKVQDFFRRRGRARVDIG